MTEDLRAVPLDADQFAFLEELGFSFQRAGAHSTATRLLAICLAWRVSPKVGGADLSAAVSPDPAAARPPHLYACDDIDESAGLAEREPTVPPSEALQAAVLDADRSGRQSRSASSEDLTKPGRPDDASSAQGNPTHLGEPSARLQAAYRRLGVRLREIPPSPAATPPPHPQSRPGTPIGIPALDPWSRRV